jgi:DNA-binding response OmpR family regulator
MSASKTRVLIIEDNDALRVMLFTVLRHQPLGVDTAMSADEAMDKVTTCDYALILLDMNLPNGDSFTFIRRFREERAEAGTFILAVRDPKVEVELDPSMVSAVVNKPLEIDTLADVVRECALVIPPPENPLPCPPADSEGARARLDDSGSFLAN